MKVFRAEDSVDTSVEFAYSTKRGTMLQGLAEYALQHELLRPYAGKVQLVVTSPPFPLNKKKAYGNRQGEEFVQWLSSIAPLLREMLTPDGSVVVEMGNAWEPGRPVMSTLALESLLAFKNAGDFELCQTFIAHNPSRLPTPTTWVNIERIRVKDSYTNVWWFGLSDRPKADNRRILRPYSESMKRLIQRGKYNHGERPSGHNIGQTSFLKDNGGAIPPNVIEISNTSSSDPYMRYCREHGMPLHPARMPVSLAEFFIKFLSDSGDMVMDPFAGSNTTGYAAEALGRDWVAIEPNGAYIAGSKARFCPDGLLNADGDSVV